MTSKDCKPKSSLLDNFFQNASKVNVPLVTTFEITQGCNYSCHHCYNYDRTKVNSDLNLKEAPKDGLTPNEILRIIDEIAKAGALYLNFTGGEVLLHPHLDNFIKQARKNRMEVKLKTNASLLTIDRCKKLNDAGLTGIDVSLYGMSEISYEKITNKKGMLQKTLDGIIAAKNEGLVVSISIILHRYNVDELSQMIKFCQDNQLIFNFSTEVTERYDGSTGARDFEITEEQFKTLLVGEYSDIFMHRNTAKALQCSCARTVCGISYAGEVFPCIGAPIASGNLKTKSFSEIWNYSDELVKIRNLKSADFKSCMTCEHIEYCNRSSGGIYINTKDYTGCDPVTLAQAKARHEFDKK